MAPVDFGLRGGYSGVGQAVTTDFGNGCNGCLMETWRGGESTGG